MANQWIEIEHANQNNLKDISVTIPKHKMTVFTGVSGSGKSSLVFDTIVAQSRRELNETFSSYVQHVLPKYGRPSVSRIKNLPIAIPIEQRQMRGNVRSTVGTYTELYTYLRLLFSRIGVPFVGYSDAFSFNDPQGQCPICNGLGLQKKIDLHQLVDFDKSLNEGPINFPTFGRDAWRWKRYAYSGLFDLDKKIKDYSKKELDLLLYSPQIKLNHAANGWPKTALYEGLVPRFERSIINTDEGKRHAAQLAVFVHSELCSACHGARLNQVTLSSKINGQNIYELSILQINELKDFIQTIDNELVADVKHKIIDYADALMQIGLDYLNLARRTETLSGGEAQRLKIAKHMTSSLNDVLYVLDEPSAGLHPKDIEKIMFCLARLKNQGNTILIVEHNPLLIKKADYVIDIGPGAGVNGGEVIFSGTIDQFLLSSTQTNRLIQRPLQYAQQQCELSHWFLFDDQSANTVNHVSFKIPQQALTVICGVAGSGKSSLAKIINQQLTQSGQAVISISQKEIGKSSRSTLITYLDIFTEIRHLFAQTCHVSAALFSFNSQGACPNCKGKGVIVHNMYFMDNMTTTCELCSGTRYRPEVLAYKYNGKTIVDVLAMTASQALAFFKKQPKIKQGLQAINDVGLGYLKLDQSFTTLSGGELQRAKLSKYLNQKGSVYIMDEPSAGLHLKDIDLLLALFSSLIKKGNTIVIIEHNLNLISQGDWLIETGPGGGKYGGHIIFTGTVSDLKQSDDEITKPYLP